MKSSRRKHPRVNAELTAQAKPNRRNMFEGRVLNLSEGGAFLATAEKLAVGNGVILNFTLNITGRQRSCMVEGRIVWANTDPSRGTVGTGIRFDRLSPAMVRFIRDYVKAELKGEVNAEGTTTDSQSTKPPVRGQLRG